MTKADIQVVGTYNNERDASEIQLNKLRHVCGETLIHTHYWPRIKPYSVSSKPFYA